MAKSCVIGAPGKLNLHLRVGPRRPDGYHDLQSLFVALDFGDRLIFELDDSPGEDSLEVTGRPVPGEDNIINKAVALFRAATGFDKALHIRLNKRIPLGGGMGGGSSDAASTLLALDALAETKLSLETLLGMALELGSDVPFFLYGGAAWVEGRGEIVFPLDPPGDWRVLLVNPGFSCGTAQAFAELDAWRKLSGASEKSSQTEDFSRETFVAAFRRSPGTWPFTNDFLQPCLYSGLPERREIFRRIFADLRALGADFQGLTGTGSTCFGIFMDGGAADRALLTLRDRWNFTQLTFALAFSAKGVLE